jgi:uncharacterized protein (TIGR03083 family)
MDARSYIAVLRTSNDHLHVLVRDLGIDDLGRQSYCTEWDVAHVLSHMGSSAQLGVENLEAMLAGREPPPREGYQAVWDSWNAMAPLEMKAGFQDWDTRQIEMYEHLTDEQIETVRFPMMGRELDLSMVAGMRLNEHVLHHWDVAVTFDPGAHVEASAVPLLVDRLPMTAAMLAMRSPDLVAELSPLRMEIVTTDPARRWLLAVDGGLEMTPVEGSGDPSLGSVTLPAEALVRLAGGRLDAEHGANGIVVAGNADLPALLRLFGPR